MVEEAGADHWIALFRSREGRYSISKPYKPGTAVDPWGYVLNGQMVWGSAYDSGIDSEFILLSDNGTRVRAVVEFDG